MGCYSLMGVFRETVIRMGIVLHPKLLTYFTFFFKSKFAFCDLQKACKDCQSEGFSSKVVGVD